MSALKHFLAGVSLALAAATAVTPVSAASFAPANGKLFLIGQSNKAAWDNWVTIGGEPAGGSIYYEVKSAAFNKGLGNAPIHQQYADFISGKSGKFIQVGVSWKDNPPGWNGDDAVKVQASQAATAALANGTYLSNFDNLINYINAHGGTKFLLRLDYEVSRAFHCTDSSCSSYKNAFNRIATYIRGKNTAANVAFVYHPVRGEFDKLYPGDANVDWIGLSTFNHELCMPIYNQTQYLYNGTPGVGFDTAANKCKGYILVRDANGNNNAQPYNFDYDFNVLAMVKFSKDHGKPMIYSESSPMNFQQGQNSNGTDSDALAATWANRYFALMNYNGPLPNQVGNYDLSGVIKAVVYMNLDLRYGWDGYYGQSSFAFPFDDMWFNNVEVSRYNAYKTAFCNGLSANGFLTTCGGGTTPPPTGATLPSGNYQLINKNSNKCVDVSCGNTANNANIVQWDCIAGAQNQQWQFVATDSGFYRLTARHSGKVIDIAGGNTANGAKAIQWEYLGGANQQWKPFDVGGGFYKFISRSSGRALELPGCNTANGTQLQQWDDLNNACQSFRIAQVTDTGGGGGGGTSTNVPGTVTSTSFTGSKSFTVNVTAAGTYYFRINYSATASSRLITTSFNGANSNAAVNSGSGTVQSTDFASVAAGSKTLTINAESGVTITSVEALKR
ncbi:RICIN domain-containing protein [Niveibacterium sp. SC-1]|uniref:RICIN domain-containing protein n=1 Tax=Niveibacterium sp. SC-1 TaxID=3135646 RepID=UPI00311EC8DA